MDKFYYAALGNFVLWSSLAGIGVIADTPAVFAYAVLYACIIGLYAEGGNDLQDSDGTIS